MKIWDYLKGYAVPAALWLAAGCLAEGVLLLFGGTAAELVFVGGILFGAGILAFLYDYRRKAAFYNRLWERLDSLEEKYLVVEMLKEPQFLEGRLLYQSYMEILKSMNDAIARHERVNGEFRQYAEAWIHEIKIPIASARLILHNSPGEISRKLKEQLTRIDGDVEQVLYYIRSEVPQNDYSIGRHSLREIVEEAVRENKDSLILNRFSVNIEIGAEAVYTDRKWLSFVLGQIISNAVKYAGEAGRRICFRAEKDGTCVRLQAEDSGIGIVPEDLPRIFEKSFTGTNGRRTVATGMGLYICRKLCEELGHRIAAESEPGRYTRIILEFAGERDGAES